MRLQKVRTSNEQTTLIWYDCCSSKYLFYSKIYFSRQCSFCFALKESRAYFTSKLTLRILNLSYVTLKLERCSKKILQIFKFCYLSFFLRAQSSIPVFSHGPHIKVGFFFFGRYRVKEGLRRVNVVHRP